MLKKLSLIVAISCISFVAAQAADAKRGPERWEKDILKFEEADKENPPPKAAVLFIGSSSIRKWDSLATDFPKHKVINRGFGGSEVSDSLAFVDRIVLPYKPRMIFMYAGDNDISKEKTPDQVFKDFREFVKRVHAELPETDVCFIAIKPSLKRWELVGKIKKANDRIEKYASKRKKVHYVDIFKPMLGKDGKPKPELFVKDGLHLSPAGYELWAKVTCPFLP